MGGGGVQYTSRFLWPAAVATASWSTLKGTYSEGTVQLLWQELPYIQ